MIYTINGKDCFYLLGGIKMSKKKIINFCQILLLLLSILTPLAQLNTSYAADLGEKYITKTELTDENNNSQDNFSIYDSMHVIWNYNIPAGTDISEGDTMTVTVPDEFTVASTTTFDIKDSAGNVIGTAKAIPGTNGGKATVVVTFNKEGAENVKNGGLTGNFYLTVKWNTEVVQQGTTVNVDWAAGGSTTINIDPSTGPNSDETLYKWGWVDPDDSSIIHWRVRVNYANQDIKNAIYTDKVGANQTLVSGSIHGYNVKFKEDHESFDIISNVPDANIKEDSATSFTANLGDITGPVIIDYETKATDGGASSTYENSGTLTGTNFVTQDVTVHTPTNGGGGNGDTTVSVAGTKTWADNNNQDGLRPSKITIDLYQNGKKIKSTTASKASNWKYQFTGLTKYDSDNKAYVYTVKEEAVANYTTTQNGYNFTNTYQPATNSLNVTKKWNDGDKLRPKSIQVQLYANGVASGKPVTVTANNDWKYTFTNLPLKANGKTISYTVKEVNTTKGYTASVDQTDVNNVIITNTHSVTPITPNVVKTSVRPTTNKSTNTKTKSTNTKTKLPTTVIPSYVASSTTSSNAVLPKTDMKRSHLELMGVILLGAFIGGSFYYYKRNKKTN